MNKFLILKEKKKRKKLGFFCALSTMLLQGFEGIYVSLMGIVFLSVTMINPAFSSATLLGKEMFGLLFSLLIFGPSAIKGVVKKIKSKAGIYYILSGLTGTAIGNTFYIIAINLGGPGYGVILTGLYPVFSLLLIRFIIKKHTVAIVWVGAFISILGSILFIILPSIISNEKINTKRVMGMIIGGVAALFWAIEGMFVSKASNCKKNNFTSKEINMTRSISAFFSTLIFAVPLTLIWGNPFNNFKKIFSHWQTLLIIIGFAANVVLLRFVYNMSIEYAGLHNSSIVDSNNFMVTPFLTIFLSFSSFLVHPDGEIIFEPIIWWEWFFVIPIILGVLIILKNNEVPEFEKNMENLAPN